IPTRNPEKPCPFQQKQHLPVCQSIRKHGIHACIHARTHPAERPIPEEQHPQPPPWLVRHVSSHIAPTYQRDHSPHEPALSSMKQNLHSLSQRKNKTWKDKDWPTTFRLQSEH